MKKERKHRFLKHPILATIFLPLLGIIGVSLITGVIILPMQNLGIEPVTFNLLSSIIHSVIQILLAFVIILIMKRTSDGSFQFGFSTKNLKSGIILASIALIFALFNILEAIFYNGALQGSTLMLLCAVLESLAAGFYEEVACRGVVVSNMMDKWKSKSNYILQSILIPGIIFGLLHLVNLSSGLTSENVLNTLFQVMYAAGMGIFLGAVYLRTRNLWGAFLVHFITDATDFVTVISNPSRLYNICGSIALLIFITAAGLYLVRPSVRPKIEKLWA